MEHAAEILLQLFVLLLATKIGDEVFKRLRQPTVIGEILGGVVVGPSVLDLYRTSDATLIFAEIGVVLLLFRVGLETRLGELLGVGATAAAVGALGVLLPFGGGFALGLVMGESTGVSVFLAAALVATSVGITSRVLADLGALRTQSGRIILGAAVIDDVLAMLILSVAAGIVGGGVDAGRVVTLILLAFAFVGVVLLAGTRILRRHDALLTVPSFAETPFLPGIIIMLGLAALAALIGLAAIVGAFLAGMVVGESSERHALEAEVAPLTAFFTPFFFGTIGAQVDLRALVGLEPLLALAAMTAIAVVTKFGGAFLGAARKGWRRALLVGWGMVPRGEVGIVVAGLGLQLGAIDGPVYSVVIGMTVATTLLVPPLMPRLVLLAEPEYAALTAAMRQSPRRNTHQRGNP